jgi:hypothetical protein
VPVPIDPQSLSSFASEYAKAMTSIRGRRVQRLLKREFGGADCLLPARTGSGAPAVLGLSAHGAALCATDGATQADQLQFDLHKDSLPLLGCISVPLARLREQLGGLVAEEPAAPNARPWLSQALQVLR